MVLRRQNPWESESRARLVSIGSHSLYVSANGPPRAPGAPVVILFTGAGVPVAGYVRLQRLLSASWRVYFHDRAGYNLSERGPVEDPLTAQRNARELHALLQRICVPPPYVLVAHSYGGIVARAFAARLGHGAITGMLLIDTGTELMYAFFPRIPDASLEAVGAGVDLADETHFARDSRLTDAELVALQEGISRTAEAARVEDTHGSAAILAREQQFSRHDFDPHPVSVVRCNAAKDFRVLYDVGVRRGQGTKEQRVQAKAFIERWETFDDELKAAQLRLSGHHRYTCFANADHQDVFRRPEVYVEQLRWVMDNQIPM